jgi:hypothetical protein
MSGIEAMIAQAEKSLGLREPNYIQSWYRGRNGSAYAGNFPWCNASITYWAYYSGNHAEVCFGTDYAYTVAHAERFRVKGRWHFGTSGIARGDIVFFDWAGTDRIAAIDHVGIVTGVRSDGKILTIEGNTNNVCARRVRGAFEIAGYGRPAYKGATSTPTPAPAAKYQPFPGAAWFARVTNSPIYTAMGKRLVAEGCGLYKVGPGPQRTEVDERSYEKWQRKCGYSGSDAKWPPGKDTWDRLKVPKVV